MASQLHKHNPSNDDVLHEIVTRLTTLSSSLVLSKPLTEYDEAFGDPPLHQTAAESTAEAATSAKPRPSMADADTKTEEEHAKASAFARSTSLLSDGKFVDPLSEQLH